MDTENCFYILVKRLIIIQIFQIDRYQPGLPVMAMYDIRAEIDNRKRIQYRPLKDREFLHILIDIVIRPVS